MEELYELTKRLDNNERAEMFMLLATDIIVDLGKTDFEIEGELNSEICVNVSVSANYIYEDEY